MLTLPIWAFVLCVLAGPVAYAALDVWRARRQPKRGPHQIRYEFVASGHGEVLDAIKSVERASNQAAARARAAATRDTPGQAPKDAA